ncbi:MAG: formylglycine-generating enzyme family protein [bacterium]|nr:formylglycine-generating enzyme family protein [bacterium]
MTYLLTPRSLQLLIKPIRLLYFIPILLALSAAAFANEAPVVSNVQVFQRSDGSGLVDIIFDLFDADGDEMTLRLFLSEDGGVTFPVECLSVTPPPGSSFTSGSNRSLIWDARTDYPNHQGSYKVRVQADDLQGTPPPVGFVEISVGSFWMGSPEDELGHYPDELLHNVTLSTPFQMLNTEVTNQQYVDMAQWAYSNDYCTVIGMSLVDVLDGAMEELLNMDDVSCEITFTSDTFIVDVGKEDYPVTLVSWFGAARYCDWLSLHADLPRAYEHGGNWACNGGDPYNAQGWRLPTEAEWEYSCRAETGSPFNTGECLDAYSDANYRGNIPYPGCPPGPFEGRSLPVGSFNSNDMKLYDSHGNLWEWCNDWYLSNYYESSPEDDPPGPSPTTLRVARGGSWISHAQRCRSAARDGRIPSGTNSIGFRPVRSIH